MSVVVAVPSDDTTQLSVAGTPELEFVGIAPENVPSDLVTAKELLQAGTSGHDIRAPEMGAPEPVCFRKRAR